MKLASVEVRGESKVVAQVSDEMVVDLVAAMHVVAPHLPMANMLSLIESGEEGLACARKAIDAAVKQPDVFRQHAIFEIVWKAPVIKPGKIGSAHVCTPVTNAHLVCRLLLEKKKIK